MEEKKQNKKNLKIYIIILLAIVIIGIAIYFIVNNKHNQKEIIEETILGTVGVQTYNNKTYYIIRDDYSGEYDLQYISLPNSTENFEKKEVMTYTEYNSYCNEWGINKSYSDTSKNYIVFSYIAYGSSKLEARLGAVTYDENDVNLYIWDDSSGVTTMSSAYCIVIPAEREIDNINIVNVIANEDQFYDITYLAPDEKPVIYLYPTEETEISVKLLNDEKITCSYPKYVDEWNVLAKPNGDLTYLDTGRKLYALYYESENVENFDVCKDGFVIKGKDSAKFLEEKLAILGLTEREAEEFIIYWLPKLESNKYNYIRFATDEEINNNMPLEIKPNPDTIIRVLMTFKGLENPIEVEEQKLDNPERNDFTVVEWGGTEIK